MMDLLTSKENHEKQSAAEIRVLKAENRELKKRISALESQKLGCLSFNGCTTVAGATMVSQGWYIYARTIFM